MVAVHWGIPIKRSWPNINVPGQAFIEAGVIILGHHAHTFHAVEVLKGVPVLYSVGNFIRTRRLIGSARRCGRIGTKGLENEPRCAPGCLEFENGSLCELRSFPLSSTTTVSRSWRLWMMQIGY